jgi:hypothetical protein
MRGTITGLMSIGFGERGYGGGFLMLVLPLAFVDSVDAIEWVE